MNKAPTIDPNQARPAGVPALPPRLLQPPSAAARLDIGTVAAGLVAGLAVVPANDCPVGRGAALPPAAAMIGVVGGAAGGGGVTG
jgi:hypothetical protein